MKQKLLPVAFLLLVLAIGSSPSHSNGYAAKGFHQTSIMKSSAGPSSTNPEKTTGSHLTDSPVTILLSF
ncbi:hypothetical protein [Flavihumibacter fluvii]|uniref:hypothetical protein n=1 Tax=Flavihumibacter fluvii TaxID=2838157 RepID=UPI001BDF1834|nr:hypothetical protein [Flavihumibacter fluvii]ULQ54377.1 hypothetical protein KJS93_08610 [Flavihumibacter fluvii]